MATLQHAGRYELLLELARGGMAELFLGRLHGAGGFAKLVAIKRILPHLAQDKQFMQMFLDEGRIAARLSHPNVCQVFELGDLDGQLFLAMEYLEGVSFAELIAHGRPEPRLVAGVLAQAAEGLHYAHSLRDHAGVATPVVHRDVSPQNLFVTVDGVCKLLDFGVSKVTTDPSRTKSGVVKGKLPYMPPEQIRGDQVDGRADVFALGVCAWEAFAGERLFDRPSDYLTWQAITEEPVPALSSRWAACPPAVEGVVLRALAREPAQRQPSAQVFADELRGVLGFASSTEIANTVRTQCAASLAARSQRVAAALAGRPVSAPVPTTGPVTSASETLDLRPQHSTPAASMELREHSAAVERPTVPPPLVSPEQTAVSPPAHPSSAPNQAWPAVHAHGFGAPHGQSGSHAYPPGGSPGSHASPQPSSGSHATSRVGVILVVALLAAALAVVITVVALRRGTSATPADAAVVVTVDAREKRIDWGLDQLDEGMKRLDRGLEQLKGVDEVTRRAERIRAKLNGGKPDVETDDVKGRLKLSSELAANVFDGDEELGATPIDTQLAAGEHELRLVFADGREQTKTVVIRPGKTTLESIKK